MRWVVASAVLLTACGPLADGRDAGADTFIAFARDFTGYTTWEAFPIAGGVAQGASHLAGDRTIYLSRRPAHAAAAFPVGTLIVKTLAQSSQVFAMAKRGGNFNADG